jgi:hypothetical protein
MEEWFDGTLAEMNEKGNPGLDPRNGIINRNNQIITRLM